MFANDLLKTHLQTSSTIDSKSLVTMEWNLNDASNIAKVGNYRHTPGEYTSITKYDPNDAAKLYTGATDSDIAIVHGIDNQDRPIVFQSAQEKSQLYFSLEECFGKFRPRSGINKFLMFPNIAKPIPQSGPYMAQRPRYYFADKTDVFKYWTSYRNTINDVINLNNTTTIAAADQLNSLLNVDKGISSATQSLSSGYPIYDAAPFVVYKSPITINKVVIKMQTNIGNTSLSTNDPFAGDQNKTTPKKWKLQYLEPGTLNWTTMIDSDTSSIYIPADGYVEFSYGLNIPSQYQDHFVFAGSVSSKQGLPKQSYNGYTYYVESLDSMFMWLDLANEYVKIQHTFGWSQSSEQLNNATKMLSDFSTYSLHPKLPQTQTIAGLRIVVDEMNTPNSTFDLIELSPRIFADISDRITSFQITKQLADLSSAGLPVGNMLVSTGSLTIFDFDQAFSENNQQSILHNVSHKNAQVKFYEAVLDVIDSGGSAINYYIPVSTMYVDGSITINPTTRQATANLRDLSTLFENTIAPQMLLNNQSLSYILTMLFDSIGFSNYVFKRVAGEHDEVIPYFFIGPDTSVAQVLQQLAISTQTAMFFDETNTFVMMSKNYLMPTITERPTDIQFTYNNGPIIGIASQQNDVYNSGKITYTSRYIQKTYGSIEQSSYDLKDKTWIYKPVLLWEVSPTDNLRPTNEEFSTAASYSLSAIPLNTDLSDALPIIVNGQITNNIIDFGEGIDWLSRYAGYFYANGEIIKYDAVEHLVTGISGPVWISNAKEYADYFSKLSFNGKIYPTGRVRIYSEPLFNLDGTYQEGPVAKHGRAQFGTPITKHTAGLSTEWQQVPKGCYMDSSILFNADYTKTGTLGKAGIETNQAKNATVNSIIKNFLSSKSIPESIVNTLKSTVAGSVQSSALVLNGPAFDTNQKPTDYLSYVYKDFKNSNRFVHFGTRMRIIGSVGNTTGYSQTPIGSSTFFNLPAQNYTKTITNLDGTSYNVQISTKDSLIGGSSGGIAVLLNSETNNGYYFEIAALTDNNINNYSGNVPINNMFFYKVARNTNNGTTDSSQATPIMLWAGLAPILVDDGKFTGQSRSMAEKNPTVYDLAVEYEDKSGTRTFYLYVNNKVVAVVNDTDPFPHVNDTSSALFVRGSSMVMFENIYGLSTNYATDTSSMINAPIASKAFGTTDISTIDSFRKYSLSGMISSTYLAGLGSGQAPEFNIYYDEFGTIMREAAYMNIRYDKAYPALISKISPTFNNLKGYTVSGFVNSPYGAEFLIFNNTDSILTLDEASGNYLRIQGVTFTQQSQNELTVDDYFSNVSDFSKYKYDAKIVSQNTQIYNDIKISRMTYGKKDFVLDAPFIQSQDAAYSMMDWIIKKVMHPRKSVGMDIFAMPILQLGDIVTLDYTLNGVDELSNSRFIVYNISYSKDTNGPKMTVYLSEVVNG